MMFDDREVEVRKFKMDTEKVKSENDLVQLCKKYLKSKSIAVDNPLEHIFKPQEVRYVYIGRDDIIPVRARFTLNDYDFNTANGKMNTEFFVKKSILENILREITLKDLITFESYKDISNRHTIVQGELNIWKKPNVK